MLLVLVTAWSTIPAIGSDSRGTDFNRGWSFHAGPLSGASDLEVGDWEPVQVPHDWAITGPFDKTMPGSQAKLPWKTEGWYRKTLPVPADHLTDGRRIVLLFGGVMSHPHVYVNGELTGSWRYGYSSFHVDITEHLRPGENTIAVHASNLDHHSRWYPGAGIYRPVHRLDLPAIHVPVWGVRVTTPTVSDTEAVVRIETEVSNTTGAPVHVAVAADLYHNDGSPAASAATVTTTVNPGETRVVRQRAVIPTPRRWDVTDPHLYEARTTIAVDDAETDAVTTTFGVRTFEWTADDGFHLNGRRVQLNGVNLHHDNGPIGAVALRDAIARKLRIMKAMGVNAIRTSHNPPSTALLELCDELGLLVINELFDKWGHTAGIDVPTAEFVQRHAADDVRNFVRRDRNHPSVVLWSVGNEIRDVFRNADGRGAEHIACVAGLFAVHDDTRPNSMGIDFPNATSNGVLEPLDTMGWNYNAKYQSTRARYAHIPQYYSESASAFSTRGFYAFPHPEGRNDFNSTQQETSYDRTAAEWSDIPDAEFARLERDTYLAGEFVWTGFDYLGEPTPHTDEARSSYFGIVDLVGLPKDRFYLYRSHWRNDTETVHILPHWNWPDRVGRGVPVYVYTSGDEAELFLNGVSLGRKRKLDTPVADIPVGHNASDYYRIIDRYRLRWEDVTYAPGELRAVAYRDGRQIGTARVHTAGEPAALRLTPESTRIPGGGQSLAYVLVECVDARGNVVPTDTRMISFDVEGPATIAGIGNGDPMGYDPFHDARHPLLAGKAVVILRTNDIGSGEVHLTAAADGVQQASTIITVRPGP